MLSILFQLCLLTLYVNAQVRELTPADFDSVVDGSKNVFVKFYAPWCGHCKTFAPELEKAGDAFKGVNDVVIAKLDADAHKEFAGRFNIQGFPTLKFFAKGSKKGEDYDGDRSAEGVIKYVNEKAGTNAKLVEAPSVVTVLDESNFESIALDKNKHVLVEFYAPWCGHCKKLTPIYEKLAQVFEHDSNIVIAKVDATANQELAAKYEIQGYPTLKFFPQGSKIVEPYEGGRALKNFVQFINEKTGTRRNEDGSLMLSAGRFGKLDVIVKALYDGDKSKLDELKNICKSEFKEKDCQYYLKFADTLQEKGSDYINKERTRLDGLMKSPSVGKDKKDGFRLRYNVLSGFVEGPEIGSGFETQQGAKQEL